MGCIEARGFDMGCIEARSFDEGAEAVVPRKGRGFGAFSAGPQSPSLASTVEESQSRNSSLLTTSDCGPAIYDIDLAALGDPDVVAAPSAANRIDVDEPSDLDAALSPAPRSPKTSFSDSRDMSVEDLPLVSEDVSEESAADCEGSLVDDASDFEFAEVATLDKRHGAPLGDAAHAGVQPCRVFAMRDLPSLEEILDAESDEDWSSFDEDVSGDEMACDADDEIDSR